MCVCYSGMRGYDRSALCREGRIDLGRFIELKFSLQSQTRERGKGQTHFHELCADNCTLYSEMKFALSVVKPQRSINGCCSSAS